MMKKKVSNEGKVNNSENSNNKENVENNKFVNKEIKSILRKIKDIIEYTIIFVVVFCNGVLIGRSFKNPNKTPDLFGEKAYIIISGSMIPTIQIGDIVLIHDAQEANIGDIIAFKKKSTVIVHRVIDEKEIDNEIMYQTKGDNNNIADLDLVAKQDIEGVYHGKIPFVGKIIMFLYNNLAIVVIVLVVIMLIRIFI